MSGYDIFLDKATNICIGVALVCIVAILYIISRHTYQISSIENKIDIIHKKVNGILGIIGIVAEEGRDMIHAEMAKQVEKDVPMENLEIHEIRAVDEPKDNVSQEESVLAAPAPETISDLVEVEELK